MLAVSGRIDSPRRGGVVHATLELRGEEMSAASS
jgi:hypothetical protein